MKTFFNILFILILILNTGMQGLSAQSLTTIRYMPHWLHQAQFAGLYMAYEKGYYADAGLNVEILDGGPAFPMGKVFTDDIADMGTMFLSGAIELADEGVQVVNIGQLSKKSALIFIAKKSDSINTVDDFHGKKIGIWRSDFRELPMAFIKKYNINAEIVPITSTINLFLEGGIDIMCVMWYNEYDQVYLAGIDHEDLNAFYFFDYGLNFPEDGIYCKKSFLQQHTGACRNFVEATMKGWKYAFDHKEETLDVVLQYMKKRNIPANLAHQRWMLDIMENVILGDGDSLNIELSREDYLRTARVLKESGSIDKIMEFDEFFKAE